VRRKLEFLDFPQEGLGTLQNVILPIGGQTMSGPTAPRSFRQGTQRRLRAVGSKPSLWSRLLAVDRFIEARIQSTGTETWAKRYRGVRRRIRQIVG
jgi:hypothetical protein